MKTLIQREEEIKGTETPLSSLQYKESVINVKTYKIAGPELIQANACNGKDKKAPILT